MTAMSVRIKAKFDSTCETLGSMAFTIGPLEQNFKQA